MSTTIRPETSKKNPYYIEKHRYYELKHFCLQYDIWRKTRKAILDSGYVPVCRYDRPIHKGENYISNPTAEVAENIAYYSRNIRMIEEIAVETDFDLSYYILKAVTEGLGYNTLYARWGIPCGRDMFYDRYRKFFWLLDKARE